LGQVASRHMFVECTIPPVVCHKNLKEPAPTAEREFKDTKAICVMDAGNNGVVILADKMPPPRRHGMLIPGLQAHAMKLGLEKYFLWKARNGYMQLS